MKLTVLGCYGPYPPAGGACSGYLLEKDNCSILLDCGNGVLSKLQYHLTIDRLDAVFLSHLHSDHISDLFILRYALQFDLEQGKRDKPLKIYTPVEPAAEYERLPYKDVFLLETITEDSLYNLGTMKFSFKKTSHQIDCYAMRIETPGEKVFVYTGDTGFFPEIISFAEAADLLLCEANFLTSDLRAATTSYHLSALQAAYIARDAGVKKLILTHLPPHCDRNIYLEEASSVFPTVELAAENIIYYL